MRLVALLLLPTLLNGQTPPAPSAPAAPAPVAAHPVRPVYRGFGLAVPYSEFTTRARTVALPGAPPLVCNTSRRTAQLMECGLAIRDPADSARFYLGAYVLEGRVALLSFGDSGGTALVERVQRDLTGRYGRAHTVKTGSWEWRFEREVVRLTWRGRGAARWIYIALWDDDVMSRIGRYAKRPAPPPSGNRRKP